MILLILSYVSGSSVCPTWRSVCSGPLPIFNWVVCLPEVESYEFFVYFGDQTLVQVIICRYIFPYGWIPFHFVEVFFSHAEAFLLVSRQFYSNLCGLFFLFAVKYGVPSLLPSSTFFSLHAIEFQWIKPCTHGFDS